MADCSYSRCVQERRNIRRELQKWTKNMVYIVGLERIAEELMGRRKWKLYQECIFRSQHQQQLPINNNVLDSKIKQEIVENDEQERLKDWSPQSKCYFCVDGKLDSDHTTRGALSPRPSDSESSDSPSDSEAPPTLTPSLHLLKNSVRHGHAGSRLPGAGAMTSLVPPAAAAAAAAAGLPFYPPLFASAPNWYLSSLARNLHQQQRDADADKPGSVTTAEQPLDLSAKPGHSNMSRIPAIDTKQIFKAKPRMSAVSGRRTYTEEELQAALRDIQSGKLGTRRAAVIYGIPRSTLRNKVYKLAMERERESHLAPLSTLADDDVMDDERELSGAEEEKEVEKALQAPLLSAADIARIADTPEALRTLLLQQQQLKSGNSKEDGWAGLEHSALGPYIQLMMAEQLAGKEQGLVSILPELMRKIIGEEEQINNGETDSKTQPLPQPSPSNSIKVKTESSDMDTDDSPANVILKIPSFKPTSNKNGGDIYRSDTGAMVSPPVTSESGSPPIVTGNMLSLREAIAKSISQKFQQSPGPEPLTRHSTPMEIDYKRVGITPPLVGLTSSIKNHHHQTQPPSDSATPPAISSTPGLSHARNLQSTTVVNNSTTKSHTLSNSNNVVTNANAQGGKGTRPKRGKYRNYDRDSLVEAVRAVQRGEMSVHRAGSYYGVPHSTLEYKVKERHLMRPRKRDPKPNPVDEKIASIKSQEIRNIPDKMKTVIKPPQKFPPTSPNGMKMPAMFDTPLAPLGYTPPPFPFWPHPSPFPHLPLDYPRNPSTSQFATNPEYYASQMMQQLQERSGRCHGDGASTVAAGGANGTNNSGTSASLAKSAREMAESLYDGTGSNGSFLDGIIRSSLESGVPNAADSSGNKEDKNIAPENLSNKALLDQLCRNSRITPLPKPTNTEPSTPSEENYVTSPLNFLNRNITEETSLGKNGKCRNRDDIQTIELSNDSNESTDVNTNEDDIPISNSAKESPPPPSRIYVKPQFQELTKPENLKPEVLVRFRTASDEPEPRIAPDSNGLSVVVDTGSASDKTEVALD